METAKIFRPETISRQGERFPRRIYTDAELSLYARNPQSLAARFAGKEAVIKHDLIAGAHPRAVSKYNEASKEIYSGLKSKEIEILDTIINSHRTSTIDKYKLGIRRVGAKNFPKGYLPEV